MSINLDGNVYIYIDSKYAIHNDAKVHFCMYLIIEKGVIINIFNKFDIETNS